MVGVAPVVVRPIARVRVVLRRIVIRRVLLLMVPRLVVRLVILALPLIVMREVSARARVPGVFPAHPSLELGDHLLSPLLRQGRCRLPADVVLAVFSVHKPETVESEIRERLFPRLIRAFVMVEALVIARLGIGSQRGRDEGRGGSEGGLRGDERCCARREAEGRRRRIQRLRPSALLTLRHGEGSTNVRAQIVLDLEPRLKAAYDFELRD